MAVDSSTLNRCKRWALLSGDRCLSIKLFTKSGLTALLLDFGRLLSSSSGIMVSFNWLWEVHAMLLFIVVLKCVLVGMFEGKTLMNRSRNSSAFLAEQLIGIMFVSSVVLSGYRLEPFPTMDLVKVHSRGWSCVPSEEMKVDHAAFLR